MRPDPHAHCGRCGAPFAATTWPRVCAACGHTAYNNPIPVAVVLLPVADGILVVQRAIEPGLGMWALPGGFLEVGEPWRVGAARELFEETGIVVADSSLEIVEVHSTEDTRLILLFCAPSGPPLPALPTFAVNDEVQALEVLRRPRELAFPTHTAVSGRYLLRLHGAIEAGRGDAG
ncbi:MAG: NUDIX domain-containing protein [Nannocystaceae bacterium]